MAEAAETINEEQTAEGGPPADGGSRPVAGNEQPAADGGQPAGGGAGAKSGEATAATGGGKDKQKSEAKKKKGTVDDAAAGADDAAAFIKLSIRWKLAFLIGALVIAVAGALSIYFITNQIQQLETGQDDMAKRELKVLSRAAAFGIVEEDPLRIADAYTLLSEAPGIMYGAVYSDPNNPFTQQEFVTQKRRKPKFQKDIAEAYTGGDLTGAINDKTYLDYPPEIIKRIQKAFKAGGKAKGAKGKAKGKGKGNNLSAASSLEVVKFTRPDRFSKSKLSEYIYPVYSTITNSVVGVARITFTNDLIEAEIERTTVGLAIVSIASLAVGILLSYLLAGLFIRPINLVVGAAKQVAAGGDDSLKVQIENVTNRDEIGYLAKVFNQMIVELDIAQAAKVEASVLEDQIRQAQEIQEGMNPAKFWKKGGMQIKGFTKAAKGVGGDYYDFKKLPDGRMAVLISDVSGKSVSASLVMVMIKTAIVANLEILGHASPDELIHTINQIMCGEAHIDKFATIFLYLYDPKTGILEFSNGGHGPLTIYRRKLGRCTAAKLDGMPLGIDDENEYEMARVQLEPGDIVILETDGITEAWDPDKNEFGAARLQKIILENADKNAKEIVKAVVDEVIAFEADMPPHDDKTLVIMKVPMEGEDGFVETAGL